MPVFTKDMYIAMHEFLLVLEKERSNKERPKRPTIEQSRETWNEVEGFKKRYGRFPVRDDADEIMFYKCEIRHLIDLLKQDGVNSKKQVIELLEKKLRC